mgnify:CR=1 FL=1
MAYSGGKEISNSFTLELNNLNGASEEEVNLFNLGGELDEPILTPKSVNYIFQNLVVFRSEFLFLPANPPQSYDEIRLYNPTYWVFENAAGDTLTTATIPALGNLNDINAAIKTAFTGTGWYENISVVFDFELGNKLGNFTMQAVILYDDDFDMSSIANKGINKIQQFGGMGTPSQSVPTTITGSDNKIEPAFKTGVKGEAAGVLITPRSGLEYGEILESQNGQVLDIKTINFIISKSSTANNITQQEQIYNCFTFKKKDINGNTIEYRKCPVVDVFSNPDINAIDDIQLERKADIYTLDGNTTLSYTLRAGISVIFSSEYTKLTNLLQQNEEGQEIIQVEKKNIKKNRLATGYALNKELITAEEKEKENEFNFSGSDKKKAPQIYYATASYCLEELPYLCY